MKRITCLLALMLSPLLSPAASTPILKPAFVWNDVDESITYFAYTPVIRMQYIPGIVFDSNYSRPDQLRIFFHVDALTAEQYKNLETIYPDSPYPQKVEVEQSGDLILEIPSLHIQKTLSFPKGIGSLLFEELYFDIPEAYLADLKASLADPNDPVLHISGFLKANIPFHPRVEKLILPGGYCNFLTNGSHTVKDALFGFKSLNDLIDLLKPQYESTRQSFAQNYYTECLQATPPPNYYKSFASLLDAPIAARAYPDNIHGETNHTAPDTIFKFQYVVEKE